MTDLISQAQSRIDELEAELEELRNFLDVAGRLAGTSPGSPRTARSSRRSPTSAGSGQPGSSPKEIAAGAFAILSEGGETLDREALIERLAARGVKVPGIYPNKNLATILWRNQHLFEHIQGSGYKWTGAAFDAPRK